jgi:nucleolar complex protein 3
MIRDRNFKVRPAVLRTFTALPLRVHVDEAQAAKMAQQANAKKRKRDKETAAIEAELKESQATTDKIVLARAQSDTLQAVTLTYFRILKSNDNQQERQVLLPAALEGLAKFSHLINMDTVLDLLDLLKHLLQKVDALPLDAALNCVLTAFSTLHGPGKELQIDVKEYIVPLYSQLARFISEECACTHNNTDLLLQCLTAAFLKRREFSTTRISAFVKQIWTVCLYAPPATSVPLLAFSRQMLQRYPSSVEQLLENEQDVITSGQYDPNVTDPEHCNPLATSGWELSLLKFHYHPVMVLQATSAATAKQLQLPAEGPERVRAQLVDDANDLFIAFVRNQKKHPLEPFSSSSSKQGDAKQQQRRARFVTPRHEDCQYI